MCGPDRLRIVLTLLCHAASLVYRILERGPGPTRAILESHKPCEATGQWPSDHGAEGFTVLMKRYQ